MYIYIDKCIYIPLEIAMTASGSALGIKKRFLGAKDPLGLG
jgi:hypothetical protein